MQDQIIDVAVRAGKTFWQAAFAYLVTSIGGQLSGIDAFDGNAIKNALIGIVIGACAAGLSASYNGAIVPVIKKLTAKGNGGDSSVDESK